MQLCSRNRLLRLAASYARQVSDGGSGGLDFSAKYVVLGGADKVTEGMPLAAAKAAGANVLAWGDLVSVIFNFVILAFVIFQLVKFANRMNPPAAADAGPSEVDLLTEIRDALKK